MADSTSLVPYPGVSTSLSSSSSEAAVVAKLEERAAQRGTCLGIVRKEHTKRAMSSIACAMRSASSSMMGVKRPCGGDLDS
eukprot:CAMPEP_0179140060 /NCGR_PEP_ID=MMETSP0796-20121207/67035_1 /TAXON_ID=73915 /ORGANISM="Pyrodinium bahamense, Strain pbaha01" /LENGTH=80 /DNA_ID=CAMNT_0020839559 /DNA_START=44 /DNA_END=282 /DNA_ORIENTATION=+